MMKKNKVLLYLGGLLLVGVVVVMLLMSPIRVGAEGLCYDMTMVGTPTNLRWGTPTNVTTPTWSLLYPCVADTGTPAAGTGTAWVMDTPVPYATMTPLPALTATITPPSANSGLLEFALTGGRSDYGTVSGGIDCAWIDSAGGSHTHRLNWQTGQGGDWTISQSLTSAVSGQCLGSISGVVDDWGSHYQKIIFDITVDHWTCVLDNADFELDLQSDGHNSISSNPAIGIYHNLNMCYTPSMTVRARADYNDGGQYIEYYVNISWDYNTFVRTPTPGAGATVTPSPTAACIALPDYGGESNPIASFPPLVYSYGGCTSIVPAFIIPLAGAWGLDNIVVPGISMCVMWVTATGQFMGISLEYTISILVILGLAFAIFNEFRS
jgi:hypothetical protein